MRQTAFDTYRMFLTLKNHFEKETYDYFKYNGKTSVSLETFQSRKDLYKFQKLSRMISEKEMRDFIVANLIEGRRWVGDIATDEGIDCYNKFLKRKQSLTYRFTNDLDNLFSTEIPQEVFKAKEGEVPTLVKAVHHDQICIETLTILDTFIGFSKIYDEKYKDIGVIWSSWSLLIRKYRPFLAYDKKVLKNILKEKIEEYEHGEEQETCRQTLSKAANAA